MDKPEAAFPYMFDGGEQKISTHPGMSLRDWFAAQALPTVLAELYRMAAKTGPIEGGVAKPVASMAYEMADAMLEARLSAIQEGGRHE